MSPRTQTEVFAEVTVLVELPACAQMALDSNLVRPVPVNAAGVQFTASAGHVRRSNRGFHPRV